MTKLRRRLEALEARANPPPPAVQLIGRPGESRDDVLARYGITEANRPAGLLIVRTIVTPEKREA